MALTHQSLSNLRCEGECREIHDNLGSLNLLARLLACRGRDELWLIKGTYMALYSKDLIQCIRQTHADEHNELFSATHMWILAPHERDAIIARSAIKHIDARYRALIEIYACRKSSQLFLIRQAYQERFHSCLDQDIISEPSHPCQRILVALAASQKAHQTDVNHHISKCDAKRLYEAGKGGAGGVIDEAVILEILSKRSIPQLRLTISSYKHIYGHSYTKSLKKSTFGEFKKSLQTVIKCMSNPSKYFSKLLYMSINGKTSDKSMLSRVMVTRAEVDMEAIKREFQSKYKISLHEFLSRSMQIDGGHRDFLLGLLQLSSKF